MLNSSRGPKLEFATWGNKSCAKALDRTRRFWVHLLLQIKDKEGKFHKLKESFKLYHRRFWKCFRTIRGGDRAVTTKLTQLNGDTLPRVFFEIVVSVICVSFVLITHDELAKNDVFFKCQTF